ncbi:MAG TPA: serine/threonine-protein kinase [Candidatus Polarisedimenticolia bacterium]|nr:serine/threonine-protein kinase [Candidatus Polarisedimenticolia bacterium]
MVDHSVAPTRVAAGAASSAGSTPRSPARGHTTAGRLRLSDTLDQARYLPGTVLGDRFRIVGLLGRGGMGEVYRADDLKLGQPVALKFLPSSLAADPARLGMFYDEVRLARQVAHPHVCRVYDVGEVNGEHFLSMEHIDGEDLASLLRRIGRLPEERAVQVARQICAGLAAIHEKGILHRDLKPANVMVDGRGSVRITDFGLAAVAGDVPDRFKGSGTPAYMAPEQLAGEEASVRTDVYALGLVLYELFTGQSAFEAETLQELTAKKRDTRPVTPGSRVDHLSAVIERVILRCLEVDPRERPASPLAVAAALPGGDPLAAALAAGETPSPEMVAAAGEPGALAPWGALGMLLLVLAGLALAGLTHRRSTLLGHVPARKPPAVMEERARQALASLGYGAEPADHASRFAVDGDFLRWVERHQEATDRWERLRSGRTSAVFFWYRQSPRPLQTLGPRRVVRLDDPPPLVSGMATVILDPDGRLLELQAVPDQVVEQAEPGATVPWPTLFELAGLDPARFTSAEPRWTPPYYAEERAAWEGELPGSEGIPVRVEAAAHRGRPVYFEIVGPWTRPVRMQSFQQSAGTRAGQAINAVMIAGVITGAILLARRNLRLGRGDRRGAFRVGLFAFLVHMVSWVLLAHHVKDFQAEWNLLIWGAAIGLFQSGLFWLLYLALEPFVRRRWPDSIVSWSRLLAGRLRDSLVGRDVLIGAAIGTGLGMLDRVRGLITAALGFAPPTPTLQPMESLLGGRHALGMIGIFVVAALVQGMILLFLIFLSRLGRRRTWPGLLVFFLIGATLQFLGTTDGPWGINLAVALLASALFTTVLARFGLLASVVCFFFAVWSIPFSFDLDSFYAAGGLAASGVLVALALFGFVTSLGGRSLLRRPLIEG